MLLILPILQFSIFFKENRLIIQYRMNDQEIESMSSTFFPHCCIIEVNSYFRFFFVLPFMTASYFLIYVMNMVKTEGQFQEINVNQKNILCTLGMALSCNDGFFDFNIICWKSSIKSHNMTLMWDRYNWCKSKTESCSKYAHLSKESLEFSLLTETFKTIQKINQF